MKALQIFVMFICVSFMSAKTAQALPGNVSPQEAVTLKECRAEVEAAKDALNSCNEEYLALAKHCGVATDCMQPGDRVDLSQHEPKKSPPKSSGGKGKGGGKTPPPRKRKVICLEGAVKSKDGRNCECPGDPIEPDWDGPKPAVMYPTSDSYIKYGFCAPTHKDLERAYNTLLGIQKATCSDATLDKAEDDASAAPDDSAEKEALKLKADQIRSECEAFNQRVNKIVRWRKEFETRKGEDGVPDLNFDTWKEVWLRANLNEQRIEQLVQEIAGIKDRLGKAEEGIAKNAKVNEDQQEEIDALKKSGGGNWEVQILVSGIYAARMPRDMNDTGGITGNVNLIFWADERNGVLIGGIVGHGWSRENNRLLAGARVNYIRKLDEDGIWRFRAGVLGLVEPHTRGNMANNIAPEIGIQVRPGGGIFVCDLGVAVGVTQVVQNRSLSGWEGVVMPSVACGVNLEWGGGSDSEEE